MVTADAVVRPVHRRAGLAVVREAVLVLAGVLAYFGVRGATEGGYAAAQANARLLVDLERDIGLYVEPALQRTVLDHEWLVTLMNWVYIWGHWPVIAAVLTWLAVRHPARFRLTRNAMFVSGAIGVVLFVLFPVAPPRLAGLGFVDTIVEQSSSYRVLQPPAFVNQYAAMPSLHVGWDLIIGLAIVAAASRRIVRLAGAVLPVLMVGAVVLTANHYVVDAIAGAVIALVGLGTAAWWERHRLSRRDREGFLAVLEGDLPGAKWRGPQHLVDQAGSRHLAVDNLEAGGRRAFGEEPLARADDDREQEQPVLINQPRIVQGAGKLPAAVDL